MRDCNDQKTEHGQLRAVPESHCIRIQGEDTHSDTGNDKHHADHEETTATLQAPDADQQKHRKDDRPHDRHIVVLQILRQREGNQQEQQCPQ